MCHRVLSTIRVTRDYEDELKEVIAEDQLTIISLQMKGRLIVDPFLVTVLR
jgi:hypothetical protein